MKRRAFILGAFIPYGGTRMAHSIGELLQRKLGFDVIAISIGAEAPDHGIFEYQEIFDQIRIDQAINIMKMDDILICNPSFSNLGMGHRAKCRKLMYVQGLSTYQVIDGFFDHYVSVSRFVAGDIKEKYKIRSTVIPAYVDSVVGVAKTPWAERPKTRILVSMKNSDGLHHGMLKTVSEWLRERHPDTQIQCLDTGQRIPHGELLAKLGATRYLLSLATTEGFGLVPLEAMAMGVVVCGFDGFGGREYMKPMRNCAVAPYPDLGLLLSRLDRAITDDKFGSGLSRQAEREAKNYSRERFDDRWMSYLRAKSLA